MAVRKSMKLWVFEDNIGVPSCSNGLGFEFIPLFITRNDARKFLETSKNKNDGKLKLVRVTMTKYENNRTKK